MHMFFMVVAAAFGSATGFRVEPMEDRDKYARFIGPPAPVPGTADLCRKDILIILDVSYSIGSWTFDNHVKPFLANFVNHTQLNVGPNGTHIALMVFADTAQTKTLFNFTATNNTRKELVGKMNDLDWEELKGGRTRTGLALEIADQQNFTKNSPLNARPNIPDVILLLTDGEPNGYKRNNKITGVRQGEKENALTYADSLKNKSVLIVGIAVDPDRATFRSIIEKLATSANDTYDVESDKLHTIMAKLIDSSCQPFKPGDCNCVTIASKDIYIKPGHTSAEFIWVKPGLKCRDNEVPNLVKTVVSPDVTSPEHFGAGQHTITYTYTFSEGFDLNCFVHFNVLACKCSQSSSPVIAYIKPGNSSTSVSWTVPQLSCSASLKSISPSVTPGHQFSIGQYVVSYVYSTSGNFDVTCRVNIEVKACNCPPRTKVVAYLKPGMASRSVNWAVPKPVCPGAKFTQTSVTPNILPGQSFPIGQNSVNYVFSTNVGFDLHCGVDIEVKVIPCQGRDYNPYTQLCCCGKVWSKKPGWKCCGKKYHDGTHKCCRVNYNLVSPTESCPGDDLTV